MSTALNMNKAASWPGLYVCYMRKGWGIKIVSQLVVLCLCSLLLDNERWKQAEVPAEFQDLVNSIADGRISLPERKIPGTKKKNP